MSGTVTASGTVQLPDWVNQAALQNYNTAMGLSQQPYTAYPGTIVAPFSDAQNQAFGAISNLQGTTQPYFQQALGNIQNLGATTQSLLNPYLSSVESDTVSNINRAAALQGQTLAAQAQQGGAYGGSRYGVEQGVLDSETQRNIGQAINQIQSQGWNTASGLALNQASALGSLAQGGQNATLQQIDALLSSGGMQQQQTQAGLSSALAQWQQQQNWPYSQLAIAQGALAGTPYGTTATSSQPYSSSTLSNALSTGLSALPAVGGLANSLSNLFGGGSGASLTSSTPNLTWNPNNPVGTSSLNLGTSNSGLSGGWYGQGEGLGGYGNLSGTGSSLFSNVGNWLSDAGSSISSAISSIF